jgi:signal transduction histidine kinase
VNATGPVVGNWDRLRLDQVITNLMANALKYGAGKPIAVTVDRCERHARLVIEDHGIGIAAADQGRIFERFERAVSDRHYGGLGLGLWICRQIVEALEGTIRVESEAGQGSKFSVVLPLAELS